MPVSKIFPRLLLLFIITLVLTIFISPQITRADTLCPSSTGSNPPIKIEEGFLTIKDPDAVTQFGTSEPCIMGTPASVPQFSIPTYDEMESLYFTQAKLTTQKARISSENTLATQLSQSNTTLFLMTGNLTITTTSNSAFTNLDRAVVIFVQGDLDITKNIQYTNPQAGVVFIVKGDIHIQGTVSRIDAVLISFGQLCDSWNGSTCTAVDQQLTINGSVINLNPNAGQNLKFLRTNSLNDSNNPAEVINYQPKYLVLFRDIFARDLTIWSEVE